jgi:triosephosphate isomerase (TIM)
VRRVLIVGNWKMNKTASEAVVFVRDLTKTLAPCPSIDLVLAPPFTALEAARTALGTSSPLQLAGQNMFWEDQGAYTGEISARMLCDLGCRHVILGHSERRSLFGDQNEGIRRKVRGALTHGLHPIVCIGETLAERQSGQTDDVLIQQLSGCLAGLPSHDMATVSIAYEPVWAIGTGTAASPDQAAAAHAAIRACISTTWSASIADATRILYGGSVTPQNVQSFLQCDQVDGALVGGACLQVDSFARIAAVAESIGAHR